MNDNTKLIERAATQVGPASGRRAGPGRGRLWAQLLCRFLARSIKTGSLILILPDGTRRQFGEGEPHVTAAITHIRSLRRIAIHPDLALGEAYMDGTLRIDQGDIYDFLDLVLGNLGDATQSPLRQSWRLLHRLTRPLVLFNPAKRSRRNVAHHYDLSDELYDLFLDGDRQYSCAYFSSPADTLEMAQERKKRHIAAKLLLKPGQKVLDIGSGWGGLGRSLARDWNVSVTGLTLSEDQLAYARSQTRTAGLDDKVRFHLRDYRHETGRYDRVVSVGMFEHVGPGHYGTFFRTVADRLSPDGIALIHTIGSSGKPGAPNPWIKKYIFPGGYVPSLSEILPVIEKSGLTVTDVEVLRLHYAETLREWRQRFVANRATVAALFDDRFCRMWEFYLAACEAGFRHKNLVVFQIQLAKRKDVMPLTRDYISAIEDGRDRQAG